MTMRQAASGVSPALVGLIYESAIDDGASRELLRRLKREFGAQYVQLQTRTRSSGEVLQTEISGDAAPLQALNRQYSELWASADPLAALLLSLPEAEVRRCQDHFDEAFVARDPFYQRFLVPHGVRWTVGGVFDSGADCATLLMARRAPEADPFNEEAAAALRDLLPHFRRACALRVKARRQAEALSTAGELLRQLPVAYMITDQFGRCIEGNEGFRELAGRLALHVVMGRARFTRPEQQDLWERALQETHATGLEHALQALSCDGMPCHISVKPWLRGTGADQASAKMMLAVFGTRPAQADANPAIAARKSRLTRAELEVLASLLQGLSAKSIAGQRGASVNTVRTQIVAILEKTHFNSQRELIASFGASGFAESGFSRSEIPQSSRSPAA